MYKSNLYLSFNLREQTCNFNTINPISKYLDDEEVVHRFKDLDINGLNQIKETLKTDTNTALDKLSRPLTKESVESIIDIFINIEESSKRAIQILDSH